MSNFKQCATAIRAAAGKQDLSDVQIADIMGAVERRAKARRARTALRSTTDQLAKAAEELAVEARVQAIFDKRNRMFAVRTKQQRFSEYDAAAGGRTDKVLNGGNVGQEGPAFGAAVSVDSDGKALRSELMGVVGELRKAGLLEIVRRGDDKFNEDLSMELWRITDKTAEASGNDLAEQAAQIIGKYTEAGRIMQNKAGAWIPKLAGWIMKQSHDSYKIAHAAADTALQRMGGRGGSKADFEAWRDFILPLLDERTFDDAGDTLDDRNRFLKNVWSNIVSGDHTTAHGAGDWLGGFTGPGNLAKRISQSRELHFKNARAWFKYNQRFGRGNLWEGINAGLNSAARNAALMRRWGPNPEAAFNADKAQLIRRARDAGDFKTVKRLQGWRVQAGFDAVTGTLSRPADPTISAWAQGIRNMQQLAKLGGVVLSSLTDLAVRASAFRHHGIGYFEGLMNGLESIMRGRDDGWRREFADNLAIGIDGMLGAMHGNFSATDSPSGVMTKLIDRFYRANLLMYWTDSLSTGGGQLLARNLGRNADRYLADLSPELQRSLGRFGIGEDEWNIIRTRGLKTGEDGTKFITAEGLGNAETERALRAYYIDTVHESMTIGGAREKALTTLGTQAGTPGGEALRMIMQFKTFPITFYQRSIKREFMRKGSIDGAGVAHLIIGTTALGYLAMTAKELAKGRNPRDPLAPSTWMAAMQQGGGLGIYGDFLFGQYNRFGGGFWETSLGPTAGTISQMASILGALNSQDQDTFGKRLREAGVNTVRFGVNHAPFLNLFYTRLALDYLVLWHLNEAMSPGWSERFERNARDQNAQTFWLHPTAATGSKKAGQYSASFGQFGAARNVPVKRGATRAAGAPTIEGRSL